jgi:hypothetical protein
VIVYNGARRSHGLPGHGDVVVHEHKVFRVVEVRLIDESEWTDQTRRRVNVYKPELRHQFLPAHVVLRPIEITDDDPRARDHDKHYRTPPGYTWDVYPNEHYPVCAACHEPTPCREELGRRVAEQAVERLGRYEDPHVCPSCLEPFTQRQKTVTFEANVEIPGGPAVTYHRRGKCFSGAYQYEQRLAKADADYAPRLLCLGTLTNHNDGTYECSQSARCGGPHLHHDAYQTCRCADCNANGPFGCHPPSTARRREPR